ncbi:hypothetical protein [Micromonospora siamensis]|uniref:Transmembrane protein n=1 Tax=Micromonospora siamensis TaxID=299152 RepID=A0A1C5IZE2_9ACTN|nr:hypothetical protein [Micromonospora siamensis]SCG63391.1 hypothetical protein GA0074704_3938 [Micromonospora siamensis]
MIDPGSEMRRLAGKVALLLAFLYVLVVFAAAVGASQGGDAPWWSWPLLLLPAFAFVPSVAAAVRLHRTADPDRQRALWRRSLLLAAAGSVLAVAAALILGRTT